MRVVVGHPARTEPDGTEVPESVAAFRMGRVDTDFTNPLTEESTPKDEVIAALKAQAEQQHPDKEVWVQYLVDNGDGTSTWADSEPHLGAEAGEHHAADLTTDQGQEATT